MIREPGRSADEIAGALADGDRALHADGDLPASRLRFERAFLLAEQAADAESMAIAALGLAGLWVSERRTVAGAVLLEARLTQALALLDASTGLALRVRVRLAGEADYRSGEHARIFGLLAKARLAGDAVTLADALSLAHHCLLGPDDLVLRRALAVDLIKVSFSTERRSDQMMGLLWQTIDSYAAGDPHAGRHRGELLDRLGQSDHVAVGFVVSAMEVMLAIRAGQLDDAESLARICAKNGVTAGDIDSEWWPGAQLVTIRWYQGRLGDLAPMLAERIHSPALSAVDNSSRAALAVAAALSGDRRTAASCLAVLRGSDLDDLPRSSSWLVTMAGVIEAACLLEDVVAAEQAYRLLLPYAHLPMVGGLGVTCFGSAHQSLGVASLTLGQVDRAIEHCRAAVEHNLALAHWPAVVSSRRRLAQAYRLRGQQGDADAAERELAAAASEAMALGLPAAGHEFQELGGSGFADCERVGKNWRIAFRDRSVLVPDSVGVLHLAVLIASPRQDIPAADLVAGLAVLTSGRRTAQPVLDEEAIGDYRNRLRQLDEEIDGLRPGADPGHEARARADREWLLAQLAGAAGFSGRPRAFPDETERARVAVGKAIRRAIARVTEADPVIGHHLRQSVHTGIRCSYWPA